MVLAESALKYYHANVLCAFSSLYLYKTTDLNNGLVRAIRQIDLSFRNRSLSVVCRGNL